MVNTEIRFIIFFAAKDGEGLYSQQKKTRSLVFFFKKIRDTKGTFHEKMGSIKDRNGMKRTEEEVKRR